MNQQSSIHLHIEELVLHGFPPGDRHRIGDAVETALERLMAEQSLTGPLLHSRETEWVDAGQFKVTAGPRNEALGSGVAQAVHRAIFTPVSGSKRSV